ncbi:MAG: sigma-70 family RNA polymerase sigma factor [Symploca sp. SIO2D2]|nr:sigma-70 family RNA polymerase sigma factor [Symploca sp. SIO2D2]
MGTAAKNQVAEFWQQWQELQDQLYRCCLKLMNFNPTDAEDALSQAMLKAWSKVQQYAGKIDNLKVWLMQLTRNLCIDIIRQRSKGAVGVENMEWVGASDQVDTACAVDTPEQALEKAEKAEVIQEAIASLPQRLRKTFILYFYQQRSHTEIAETQGITYDNVCKRISLARKQLKEQLSSYFHGNDGEERQQEPVYEAIAGQDCSAEDPLDTGAIALCENEAQEMSQGASVNSNPQERTDEENQLKTEPVEEAKVFSEVSVVETTVAGTISSREGSAQEKKSQEAIAFFGASTGEKPRIGVIAKRCCSSAHTNSFVWFEVEGKCFFAAQITPELIVNQF